MSNYDKGRELNNRDIARQKLPTFYGSFDNYNHPLLETINNGVDELLNNFNEGNIYVTVSKGGKRVEIEDTGRGIPLPIKDEESGKLYYQLFLETLFAGTKYDDNDDTTSGTNGVGLTVLQYTSSYFNITSNFNGEVWQIGYANGYPTSKLENKGKTQLHGTKVVYELDDTVYTNTIYKEPEVEERIRKIASSTPTIKYIFKWGDKDSKIIHYKNIDEYYQENYSSIIKFKGERKTYKEGKETNSLQVIFGIENSDAPTQESVLNRNFLREGGTINDGIISGITKFINKYCKNNALYNKNEKNIGKKDILESISFYCTFDSNRVVYEGQTKWATKKELYGEIADKYMTSLLEIISIEQKEQFRNLVNKVLISKRANEKANITRNAIKKELERKVNNTAKDRVENFIPCRSKDPKQIEFYITEGQSASGGASNARNKFNQCIYGVRGKVLNVSKCKLDEILKNKEIMDIVKIVGTGVTYHGKNVKGLPAFNINNLNMNKIIILSDEDSHGRHIASLITNMFMTLMPDVVRQGYLYRLETPLYKIETKKGDSYFAFNEVEKTEITNKLNEANVKYSTKYFKGLGSMSSEDLNWSMLPENRHLTQIKEGDIEKDMEMLDMYFKNETIADRKKFIIENGYKYVNLKEI